MNMMSLTHVQAQLLDFIKRYQAEFDGVSPSFEEMCDELGVARKSGIHRLLKQLEDRGHISRPYHRARAIQVLSSNPFDGISTRALMEELVRRGEMKAAA